MKLLKKAIAIAILAVFSLLAYAETVEEMLAIPISTYKPTRNEHMIALAAINILLTGHYSPKPITPALSCEWYNEYFKLLDYQNIYFLQSDIEDFRSYETVLWDKERKMANLDFAYKVFARFLKRVHERAQFAAECIDEKHDFSVHESYLFDRKDAQRPATTAEQHDLWRKTIKNELLQIMLDLDKEKQKDAAGELKTDEKPKSFEDKKLDMKKNYARFYKRRNESESSDILQAFLNSLTTLFDPHTTYMAPDTKSSFDIEMSLSLQGIGATLTVKDTYTTIVDIVPGGPADKDGRLKKGDRIIAVAQDGQEPVDVIDMPLNKVVSQIRGKKGTKVHLSVLAEGARTAVVITIVRDEVKLTEKEAKSSIEKIQLKDGKIANVLVMYLSSFYCDFKAKFEGRKDYKSTTMDMLRLLEKAQNSTPLDGIVIDLRGNGGGSLEEAISLTGLFLPRAPVVQIRNATGRIEKRYDEDPNTQYSGPLIVMVDRFSASASEIFAAALQDHGRAIIVGDKTTHGKGTVQSMIDLSRRIGRFTPPDIRRQDFGAIKLTMAKFYRINGGATQVEGVKSDIAFKSLTDVMKLGEASIPHALQWDEIKPMEYQEYQEARHLLPMLKEASQKRVENSNAFQNYQKDINQYEAFQLIKEIPLEIKARKAFMRTQEEADKIIRNFRNGNTNYDKDKDDDEEGGKNKKGNEKTPDLVLQETLNIMKDYISEVNK